MLNRVLVITLFILTTAPLSGQMLRRAEPVYSYRPVIKDEDEDEEEEEEEDPWKGFSVGINLGLYFANKETANFYDGTCSRDLLANPNDVRCYSIYQRLGMDGNIAFQDDYNYITDYYEVEGMEMNYDSYPVNMRYDPAFMVGLQIKYNFSKHSAIVFNSSTIVLRANDQFTLRFFGGSLPVNAQNDTRLFPIYGKEDRYHFNLGYRMGIEMNEYTNWYLQPGLSLLATRMKDMDIYLAETSYDLYVGASNPNQMVEYRPTTNSGFGACLGTGFEFFLKDKFTCDFSLTYSYDKVILVTYEDYVGNLFFMMSFNI